MTSRLKRKNRIDIIFKNCGGLNDAIDDFLKQLYRINDEEYDYIAEYATDAELQKILPEFKSFSEKKEAIIITNRLLTYYYKTNES